MQDKPIQYELGDLVHHNTFGWREDTLGIVIKLSEWKGEPSVRVQWLKWPDHPDVLRARSWYRPESEVKRLKRRVQGKDFSANFFSRRGYNDKRTRRYR